MVHSSPNRSWFPARPFPAKEWLKNRAAASPAAAPPPQASAPAATPPLPPSDELLDLALLASCLSKRLYGWLIVQLQPLAAQSQPPRFWREQRAAAPPPDVHQNRLGWLRARLLTELTGGLSVIAAPLWQMNRPARNRALVAHAEAIGQVIEALGRQPGANPPEQEFERVLARLRR